MLTNLLFIIAKGNPKLINPEIRIHFLELEIIWYLSQGCTRKRIADKLIMGGKSLDKIIQDMFDATGEHGKLLLVEWAVKHGVLIFSNDVYTRGTPNYKP